MFFADALGCLEMLLHFDRFNYTSPLLLQYKLQLQYLSKYVWKTRSLTSGAQKQDFQH